jgi:hypothetical protein
MRQFQGLDREFRCKTSRNPTHLTTRPTLTYRVGELFREGHNRWREGTQIAYGPSGLELTLFQLATSNEMVVDVQRGPAEFALIIELPLIVLAYRFGDSIPWHDVPYCWHLQPSSMRVVPLVDTSPEARVLLWVSLVGADDGIIHAQRGLTFSPSFTFALHDAIRKQSMTTFRPEECTSAISKLYLNHSNMTDRLSLAAVRTMGNE